MRLVRISEASRSLGCSEKHVRTMIRAGQWPYYKLGKKGLRVDVEEIKSLGRLIAEGEQERQKGK